MQNCSTFGAYDAPNFTLSFTLPNVDQNPEVLHYSSKNPLWIATFVFFVFYATITQIWYLYVRPLSVRLQKRSRLLLLLSSLGGASGIGVICFGQFFGRENVDCSIYFALVFMTVPLVGGPMIIRFLIFYRKAKSVSRFARALRNESKTARQMGIGESGTRREPSPTILNKTVKQTAVFQATFSFSSSNPIVIAYYAAFLLPFVITTLIIVFTDPMLYIRCYGCKFGLTQSLALLLSGGFVVFLVIIGAAAIWRFEDPLGLRAEPIIAGVSGGIFIGTAWFMVVISPQIYEDFSSVAWQILFIVGIFAIHTVQTVYQILIAKHVIRSARSVDDITLKDILDNPETHAIFKKYMVS